MQRLAGISVFVSSLVSAWLGYAVTADAQRTTTRDYVEGTERVVEEERSVVRNRGTAPRTGASSRPTSTARARQAPQTPELLEDRAGETPQRVMRSRSAPPETRSDGSPVPEGYAVDPESGEMVEYADRHLGHDHDGGYFDDHVDCPLCGGDGCDLCVGGRWGGFAGGYVRLEYLAWNMSGMHLPALVTSSPNGTLRPQAGVLGTPGVTTLFGDEAVNDTMRSGGRITFGAWLDQCRRNALEFDYFVLSDGTDNFVADSNGDPILARPFFNALTGRESAELVAFPNTITGSVAVDTLTRFHGGGVRVRHLLCCGEDCGPSLLSPVPQPGAYRYEVLMGYRALSLEDGVVISEDLTAITPPGTFFLQDSFQTTNQFNGFDLGMAMQWRRGRWTTDLQSRVAFGNTHSTVSIRGNTQINGGGGVQNLNGGLLAQRTNIGDYSQDSFSVVPEIGLSLGYDLTPNIRVLVGYSLIYWSRVARAGDQISLDVNPNLIPPEAVPFSGPLRPAFSFVETDFWAYGLNAGIEARF